MNKRKVIVIISIVLVLSIIGFLIYTRIIEVNRYEEIIRDLEEALIWESSVTGTLDANCNEEISKNTRMSSEYLISNGYLKTESMKDIDNDSYCKAYVEVFETSNCEVDYEIYLKCKNYETEGYVDW